MEGWQNRHKPNKWVALRIMELIVVTFYVQFLPREAAMLARSWDSNSVCPSVCPSVTRVLCDEIIEHTADILIPHER